MPFIDLNKNSNNTSQSSSGGDDNVAVVDQPELANNPADVPQPTPQPNIQMDPNTGVRQIDGGDFPQASSQAAATLNQANQQAAQAMPVNEPVVDQTPIVPVPPVPNPPAPTVMANTTPEDDLVVGTSTPSPNIDEPETLPTPPPVAEPANVEPQPAAVIEIETPGEVTQEISTPGVPAPLQVVSETVSQPEQALPELAEQAQPQQEVVSPQPAVVPQQPTVMQDVMDRSLPELKIKQPPQNNAEAVLEDQVVGLKTRDEQVALESRTYNLDDLLVQSIKLGASDLHLTAGYRAMARVDGRLQMIKSQVLDDAAIKEMLLPVLKKNPALNPDKDKDMDLSYELPQENARFRLNVGYQQNSMTATFRLISNHIRTPEELYLPPVVKEYTKFKQGLVLVTGPTGSGKSTTLASMINLINMSEPKHIITIEDPIEYTYPRGAALVDQRAVHIDTTSWSMALRATLRQDPDVVLIGEMRDVETMEAALQVAETGHLVFSTLHTNTAAQTIDRVIDAFPENKQSQVRTQLASVLMAVVSQRLLPIAGGGRRIAVEIMLVTSGIRNAIREGKVYQIDNMIQTGAEHGMISMEKSLAQLVREGYVSTEMAQRYANKPDDLMSLLGKT